MSDVPADELRARVRTILEREIARLEDRSLEKGLGLTEVKILDLLIRAANNFAPAPPASDKPTPADPAAASDDELLNGLTGS